VADKLLVMSSFVMLGLADALPAWIAVIVVSRDILILVGYGIIYLLLDERPKVEPSIIGKLSTLLQLVTVGAILLLLANPQMLDLLVKDLLIGAMAVATVWSGLQYLYRGLMWLQNRGPSLSQLG
jgi:cardiolipin synthase